MATTDSWHPVRPDITDPDLSPNERHHMSMSLPQTAPGPTTQEQTTKGGFFSEHKIAIIIAVIVLLIFVVVIFVYMTRKGDKKAPPPGPPARPATGDTSNPESVNIEELRRLRETRRRARAAANSSSAAAAPAATPAAATPAAAAPAATPATATPAAAPVLVSPPAQQLADAALIANAIAEAHEQGDAQGLAMLEAARQAPPNEWATAVATWRRVRQAQQQAVQQQGPVQVQQVYQSPPQEPTPRQQEPLPQGGQVNDPDMDAFVNSLSDEVAAADDDGVEL